MLSTYSPPVILFFLILFRFKFVGDELHLFSALFAITSLDAAKDTAPGDPYCFTFNSTLSYEDAMLRAYVLPMEAILLSIDPIITPFTDGSRQQMSLVSVHLPDWASYYVWRGLCGCQSAASTIDLEQFSSPVAILLHWALTVYYILAYVLPRTSPRTIASVLKTGRLTIHLIGVEHELSMLPVFKELHHLIRLGLEVRLYFIGTHVDPTVNRRIFHISDRLSAIVWAGTYHDFWGTQSNYGIDLPDVVIGLNSGLSAYASWTPTLKLIHALGVPSYFTDACLYSCAWGYKVAGYLGLGPDDYQPDLGPILDDDEGTGIHAPVLNPFRSPVHLRSAGVRWGWFKNAFIFSPIRIPDFSANKDDLIGKLASLQV
ncbi:uncharacterized protein DEA37_0011908 [Paragonimus westermani]|uniref:Mitochondrial splicing suppressor 51-like C-terminal domain-containing protein n=1 Tax=Paragonimus westermani TaxID=34504 RepID=A0A5J4NIZ0_9TREM|nr:uncharacterized protein DEA37_0011908 [Paragonimus westermani]